MKESIRNRKWKRSKAEAVIELQKKWRDWEGLGTKHLGPAMRECMCEKDRGRKKMMNFAVCKLHGVPFYVMNIAKEVRYFESAWRALMELGREKSTLDCSWCGSCCKNSSDSLFKLVSSWLLPLRFIFVNYSSRYTGKYSTIALLSRRYFSFRVYEETLFENVSSVNSIIEKIKFVVPVINSYCSLNIPASRQKREKYREKKSVEHWKFFQMTKFRKNCF